MVTTLWAAEVKIRWNPSTQNEDGSRLTDLSHYTVHYGTLSRGKEDDPREFQYQFTTNVSGNKSSVTLSNLKKGQRYFFSVTTLDFAGNESKYAKETSLDIPSSTSSGNSSSTSDSGSSGTSSNNNTSGSSSTSGSAVEVLVDNRDGWTSRTGTWKKSGGPAPWKGESLYSQGTSAKFRWTPKLPTAGTYKVYAWWTYHRNRATSVPYRIRHANGTKTVTVNQRQAKLGGKWNHLGTFKFKAGTSGYVEVLGSKGQANADAVWFGLKPD